MMIRSRVPRPMYIPSPPYGSVHTREVGGKRGVSASSAPGAGEAGSRRRIRASGRPHPTLFERALPAESLTVIVTLARTRTPRRRARLTRCTAARRSRQPQPQRLVRLRVGARTAGEDQARRSARQPHACARRHGAGLGEADHDTQVSTSCRLAIRIASTSSVVSAEGRGARRRLPRAPAARGYPAHRGVDARHEVTVVVAHGPGERIAHEAVLRTWRSPLRPHAPARSPLPASCRRTGPGARPPPCRPPPRPPRAEQRRWCPVPVSPAAPRRRCDADARRRDHVRDVGRPGGVVRERRRRCRRSLRQVA